MDRDEDEDLAARDDDAPELHDYVDAFLARVRSGADAEPGAYIEELRAEGARVSFDALQEALSGAMALERMRASRVRAAESSGGGARGGEARLLQAGDVLGDYRVLREIGAGGMGIVYEAEQQSLGRRVALKVLTRSAVRDSKQVQRFEREAKLAAGLHHTNIVPVFGSGEHEGRRYYVMQRIEGKGLDRAMQEGRFVPPGRAGATTTWKEIADIGLQVAEALDYAHGHGTLHRDIKPANLLFDDEGVVRIVDFGLARALADPSLTQSGDVVGTLRYMAPEQLRGECDERSDLYALGLTLYEMATGRAAFGPSREGLLERVRTSSLSRPSQHSPAIPRDLETILMTCVAREPEHRYANARALATDLRLFLEDRPIRARRASALEVAWRWGKRNRVLAAASAVAVLALVGATVVGWSAYGTTRRALAQARVANTRAAENHALGRAALEAIFARVAGADPNVAQLEEDEVPERDASFVTESEVVLLEELLRYYDRFGELNVEDDAARAETARAYHRVGRIQLSLRKLDAAQAAFEKSLALYGDADADARTRVERARCHNDVGVARVGFRRRARRTNGARRTSYAERIRAARADHEAAIALVDGLEDARAQLELARAFDQLGLLSRGRRNNREGADVASERVSFHERALAILDELVRADSENASYRVARARVHRHLARAVPDAEKARAHLDSAIAILDELCARESARPDHFYALVETRFEAVFGAWMRERSEANAERAKRALDAAWADAQRMMRSAAPTPAMIQLFLSILFRMDPPEIHGFETRRLRSILERARRSEPIRSLREYLELYELAAEHMAPVTRSVGADAPYVASFYAQLAKIYLDVELFGEALRVVRRAWRCLELDSKDESTQARRRAIRAVFTELEALAKSR